MDIEKSIRENQLGAKLHIGKVLGGVDTIEKSVTEDIIKGKPAVAGEIREWSGKKYKKQPNGKWMEVSEHGLTKKEHNSKANFLKYSGSGFKHREASSKLSDKEYDEEELEGGKRHDNKQADNFDKLLKQGDIIKGKPAVAGEIREWSGKKYKKQPNGKWVEVSGHGMTKKEHEDESKNKRVIAWNTRDDEYRKKFNDESELNKEQASKLSDKEYDEEELRGGKLLAQYKRDLVKLRGKSRGREIDRLRIKELSDLIKEMESK